MTLTESQKKANAKYREKSIKRIPLDVQKEEYEEIKAAADTAGEKVNGYIKTAIRQRMEREINSSPTAAPSVPDRLPEAPRTPAAVPETQEMRYPKKSEAKPPILPLTPENIAKVDLDRLANNDMRYQLDVGIAFGKDGLAKLLEMARGERPKATPAAVPEPVQEAPSNPNSRREPAKDDFARSLIEAAKRNGGFKM